MTRTEPQKLWLSSDGLAGAAGERLRALEGSLRIIDSFVIARKVRG